MPFGEFVPTAAHSRDYPNGGTETRGLARRLNPLLGGPVMADVFENIFRNVLPIPSKPRVGLITYDAKDPNTNFPPFRGCAHRKALRMFSSF